MSEHKTPSEVGQIGRSNQAALADTFHHVRKLLPHDQKLVSVKRSDTVATALRLMQENKFSQLPVMSGRAVLGVFSYRSFSIGAAERQRYSRNEVLEDLSVEEFLETFDFVSPNLDWANVQRYLDEKDAFFVGDPNTVQGLVTTMDVYRYFQEVAEPFILIEEIERTLRELIKQRIPSGEFREMTPRVLAGAYVEREVPTRTDELTLHDYVVIVTARENWHYFEDVLGGGERGFSTTVEKLQGVPNLRNDIFHFKDIKPDELRKLKPCRDWLLRAVLDYSGRVPAVAPSRATVPQVEQRSRKIRTSLPGTNELYTSGIIQRGDELSIEGEVDSYAEVAGGKTVRYRDREMSFNAWGLEVTGNKGNNIYTNALHLRTGKTLGQLRAEMMAEIESGKR